MKNYNVKTYLKWYSIEEECQEPIQGHGANLNVKVVEMPVEPRQLLHDDVFEHLLVCLRSRQVLVEVARPEILLGDGNQRPAIGTCTRAWRRDLLKSALSIPNLVGFFLLTAHKLQQVCLSNYCAKQANKIVLLWTVASFV